MIRENFSDKSVKAFTSAARPSGTWRDINNHAATLVPKRRNGFLQGSGRRIRACDDKKEHYPPKLEKPEAVICSYLAQSNRKLTLETLEQRLDEGFHSSLANWDGGQSLKNSWSPKPDARYPILPVTVSEKRGDGGVQMISDVSMDNSVNERVVAANDNAYLKARVEKSRLLQYRPYYDRSVYSKEIQRHVSDTISTTNEGQSARTRPEAIHTEDLKFGDATLRQSFHVASELLYGRADSPAADSDNVSYDIPTNIFHTPSRSASESYDTISMTNFPSRIPTSSRRRVLMSHVSIPPFSRGLTRSDYQPMPRPQKAKHKARPQKSRPDKREHMSMGEALQAAMDNNGGLYTLSNKQNPLEADVVRKKTKPKQAKGEARYRKAGTSYPSTSPHTALQPKPTKRKAPVVQGCKDLGDQSVITSTSTPLHHASPLPAPRFRRREFGSAVYKPTCDVVELTISGMPCDRLHIVAHNTRFLRQRRSFFTRTSSQEETSEEDCYAVKCDTYTYVAQSSPWSESLSGAEDSITIGNELPSAGESDVEEYELVTDDERQSESDDEIQIIDMNGPQQPSTGARTYTTAGVEALKTPVVTPFLVAPDQTHDDGYLPTPLPTPVSDLGFYASPEKPKSPSYERPGPLEWAGGPGFGAIDPTWFGPCAFEDQETSPPSPDISPVQSTEVSSSYLALVAYDSDSDSASSRSTTPEVSPPISPTSPQHKALLLSPSSSSPSEEAARSPSLSSQPSPPLSPVVQTSQINDGAAPVAVVGTQEASPAIEQSGLPDSIPAAVPQDSDGEWLPPTETWREEGLVRKLQEENERPQANLRVQQTILCSLFELRI
ncbi:hypothetical protein H0H93_012802 [Arthromyces matolae]|nr:hypothetical protein H0H93_012802 [Arthromyces matolae]